MSFIAFACSKPLGGHPLSFTVRHSVSVKPPKNPKYIPTFASLKSSDQPSKLSKALAAVAAAITVAFPFSTIASKEQGSVNQPSAAIATSTIHKVSKSNLIHDVAIVRPSPKYAMVSFPDSQQPSLADRFSFWTGEFLMWHPSAKVLALFGITLICMYLGSFLYKAADPEGKEAAFPFWHSVRAIANPLEDDWTKNSLRTTSIILASVGMVVFAILVGMVTESVESAVQNADGEMSRVVISDHILVCGWSSHVSQILKDISSVSSKMKVVVLANPAEKEQMKNELRDMLSDEQQKSLRVFYRPGAPIVEQDLRRVAASRAKKIILVNPRQGDPTDNDRIVLSRALALRQNLPGYRGDIVAELNNARDERILHSILSNTNANSVETVNAEQLLFRFMAQAIRQPGLADTVAHLMGNNSRTVFHVMKAKTIAPHLIGTEYSDIKATSVDGSLVCGYFDSYGKVQMRSPNSKVGTDVTITPDTEFLLLGIKGSSEVPKSPESKLVVNPSTRALMQGFVAANAKDVNRNPENYLVCGWRRDMSDMLRELDGIIAHGSKITILDEDAPDAVSLELKNITVTCVQKRADRYQNLEELLDSKAKPYDHVVLLGSAIGDDALSKSSLGREEDTKTLASLVYVNELLAKQKEAMKKNNVKTTMVTVEFINERVAQMAKEHGNIANAILPQNLSAKIAAQTVRDSRLNAVWRELLSQEGREVYLRPCELYNGVVGERASFANVADRIGRTNDDIVVGYISRDGSVVINPTEVDKNVGKAWDPKDVLIVLSHD